MKVSFGRIIPVKSATNPNNENKRKRVDNSTFEVAKVLNSENSSVYSKKEADSIRNFFKTILGDYNGKNGILIRRTEAGDLFMISGEDAKKLEKKERVDGYIELKAEDGKQRRKKDSEIILSSSQLDEDTQAGKQPIKAKLDEFRYFNAQRFFTAKVDGYIRNDVKQTPSPTCENRCENIFIEYQELYL